TNPRFQGCTLPASLPSRRAGGADASGVPDNRAMSAGADSLKSILFALGANFLIAVAKTGGAIFTGSSSMLAEAIHSYADCANQGLLLWGMREGRRSPDR